MIVQKLVYFSAWSLARLAYRLVWRLRIIDAGNVPEGGCILAGNHVEWTDPTIIGSSVKREVHFMGKIELFRKPAAAWFLRKLNTFPVDRSKSDIRAIKTAVRILSGGGALVMFPQGGRRKEIDEFKNGVGILSCMSGAPIIPCYVKNTDKLWKFSSLSVVFGKPIFPPEKYGKESYSALARQAIDAITGLKESLD